MIWTENTVAKMASGLVDLVRTNDGVVYRMTWFRDSGWNIYPIDNRRGRTDLRYLLPIEACAWLTEQGALPYTLGGNDHDLGTD